MGEKSKIEWTDATWNFVYGCNEVSPGCDNCYARTFTERWRGVKGHPFENGFDIRLAPDRLNLPHKWAEPKMIFTNSLSDLFHREIPFEFVARGFDVMLATPRHTYQVLTKRPERMAEFVKRYLLSKGLQQLPENIWLGTSVESQKFTYRAEVLKSIACHTRFLSMEPLLGPVEDLILKDIHWVIVGGESGHGARYMHPDWARSIRDQCHGAGVDFFFNQWGQWLPDDQVVHIKDNPAWLHKNWENSMLDIGRGVWALPIGKTAAGRLLDGREYNEMPEVRVLV